MQNWGVTTMKRKVWHKLRFAWGPPSVRQRHNSDNMNDSLSELLPCCLSRVEQPNWYRQGSPAPWSTGNSKLNGRLGQPGTGRLDHAPGSCLLINLIKRPEDRQWATVASYCGVLVFCYAPALSDEFLLPSLASSSRSDWSSFPSSLANLESIMSNLEILLLSSVPLPYSATSLEGGTQN